MIGCWQLVAALCVTSTPPRKGMRIQPPCALTARRPELTAGGMNVSVKQNMKKILAIVSVLIGLVLVLEGLALKELDALALGLVMVVWPLYFGPDIKPI